MMFCSIREVLYYNRPIEVATVTVFHNSLKGLEKLIPTIHGYFKAHIFIDGIYKNWPMTEEQKKGNGLSTDGSRELILDYAKISVRKITLLDTPFKSEYEKRMMYLDAELLIRELGVNAILILDSDEYVNLKETNWELFYADLDNKINKKHHGSWNVYGIPVSEYVPQRGFDNYQDYPSLWYKPWDMIYKPQSHYQFINCRWELTRHFNDNYSQYPIDKIEGIKVYHDHGVREEGYTQSKEEYHSWLRQHEQDLVNRKYR